MKHSKKYITYLAKSSWKIWWRVPVDNCFLSCHTWKKSWLLDLAIFQVWTTDKASRRGDDFGVEEVCPYILPKLVRCKFGTLPIAFFSRANEWKCLILKLQVSFVQMFGFLSWSQLECQCCDFFVCRRMTGNYDLWRTRWLRQKLMTHSERHNFGTPATSCWIVLHAQSQYVPSWKFMWVMFIWSYCRYVETQAATTCGRRPRLQDVAAVRCRRLPGWCEAWIWEIYLAKHERTRTQFEECWTMVC